MGFSIHEENWQLSVRLSEDKSYSYSICGSTVSNLTLSKMITPKGGVMHLSECCKTIVSDGIKPIFGVYN